MPNDFDSLIGDSGSVDGDQHVGSYDADVVGVITEPRLLIGLMMAELAVALVCFAPSTKTFHVIGYVIGALCVAITAITYRKIERRRSASASFVGQIWPGRVVAAGLALGIVIAAAHAFYFAQIVTIPE